ncbi:MAG: hypothetical protein WCA32_06260 [Chromatiaceae bacterium]
MRALTRRSSRRPSRSCRTRGRTPAPETDAVTIGLSPCEELVKQACGPNGECSDRRGCGPAKQLLAMETKERHASGTANRTTCTSGKCREALKDSFFAACDKATSAAGAGAR